jgi:hypothetical protein
MVLPVEGLTVCLEDLLDIELVSNNFGKVKRPCIKMAGITGNGIWAKCKKCEL